MKKQAVRIAPRIPLTEGVVRFDVGDTHLYFPDKTVTLPNGKPVTISGGSYQHTMQYSVGYGWRF